MSKFAAVFPSRWENHQPKYICRIFAGMKERSSLLVEKLQPWHFRRLI